MLKTELEEAVCWPEEQIRVMRTAHWECVWIQQPAPRSVNAARKRGVQADGLRAYLVPSVDGLDQSCSVLCPAMSSEPVMIRSTYHRPPDVFAAAIIHDEDIVRLHELFLDT